MDDDTQDVVQTVVKSGSEYLPGKSSTDSYWEFMGGKVEEDENLKEAAVRELREETDLNAEPVETGEYFIGRGEKGF